MKDLLILYCAPKIVLGIAQNMNRSLLAFRTAVILKIVLMVIFLQKIFTAKEPQPCCRLYGPSTEYHNKYSLHYIE